MGVLRYLGREGGREGGKDKGGGNMTKTTRSAKEEKGKNWMPREEIQLGREEGRKEGRKGGRKEGREGGREGGREDVPVPKGQV